MSTSLPEDPSGVPMMELFKAEAETQVSTLNSGLLELERGGPSAECLKTLMRAAHSLKGAARIVNVPAVERLAHDIEDCFELFRQRESTPARTEIDLLFRVVDTLGTLIKDPAASSRHVPEELQSSIAALLLLHRGSQSLKPAAEDLATVGVPQEPELGQLEARPTGIRAEAADRVLRLAAENLNRLLGLAGEALVESRWLKPFADSLLQLKRRHAAIAQNFSQLRQLTNAHLLQAGLQQRHQQAWSLQTPPLSLDRGSSDVTVAGPPSGFPRTLEQATELLDHIGQELAAAQELLAEKVQELEGYERRSANLSQRLYLEVVRTRMRPFSEGVRRFPRLVRDLAHSLNKQVRLEIDGDSTQVDRDLLERLETPLAHLLRNAVDHGCERPEARERAGKAPECVIRLEARHSAGVLLISVSDDGTGVNTEELRRAVVRRRLLRPAQAEQMPEPDLLEFLFMPGFTLKLAVTEISGRGFGLDIVQNMVRNVRGSIRLHNQPGRGFRVQLQLPLTLSVLRALLVDIAAEPYAIPLNQIGRTLKVDSSGIHHIEGRQFITLSEQPLELISAQQILETELPHDPLDRGSSSRPHLKDVATGTGQISVLIFADRSCRSGLVVDRFLGERELVVQPLQGKVGKVRDVSAAALMEDGSPVLILDVEQLIKGMQSLAASVPSLAERHSGSQTKSAPKKILVVDDSPAMRRLEQQLLTANGFITETAVDGLAAWNLLRQHHFDLVITDIEMPHVDGFQLAAMIKQQPDLKSTSVLVLSYRDRDEDRLRAKEVGADYYLTKASFHDRSLLRAVFTLIGDPRIKP